MLPIASRFPTGSCLNEYRAYQVFRTGSTAGRHGKTP